jgi:hypothetical protein
MPRPAPLSRRAFLTQAGMLAGAVAAGTTVPSGATGPAGTRDPGHARTGTGLVARARSRHCDLALTHATLLDPATEGVHEDRTVLIRGERIVAVGRSAETPVRDAAQVFDLRGGYLLPGLCDMHVHTSYEDIDLPLQIANGVTTVREMWGHPWVHEWRERIEAGTLLGPRYVIGSQIIDGSPTLWNDPTTRPSAPITVTTPDQARAAVRSEAAAGADFIKIYSRLTAPVFTAVADECARIGIRFCGHCPDRVPVERAAAAGMWSFEHLDGLWWSTSAREPELRRSLAAITIDPAQAYDSWFEQIGALEWIAATSYDPRRADRLFDRLRRARSWQVPTLTLNHRIDIPDGSHDPRLKYVPAGDAAFWQAFATSLQATRTPAQRRQHRVLFRRRQQLVAAMHNAGVGLLAGTDVGTTYQFPGFSLHDELAFLVQSGLPPMHALRAATSDPARALGTQASSGAIRPGFTADLVALADNPLADIGNTRSISATVVRGRLIDAAARRQLLQDAQQAAQAHSATATAPARRGGCGCTGHALTATQSPVNAAP